MRLACLTPVIVLLAPALVAAQEKTEPTLIVQIKPLDGLFGDARSIAPLVDRFAALDKANRPANDDDDKPAAKNQMTAALAQLDAVLGQLLGENWKKALDPTKPIGLYGTITPNPAESTVVLMVPSADPKELLAIMAKFGIETKETDGIHEFTPPNSPFPAYLRFGKGYAWATVREPAPIKGPLPDPATLLSADARSVLSLRLRIDRIPEQLKDLTLGLMNQKLKEAQDAADDDTKAALGMYKPLIEQFKQVVVDGQEAGFSLEFDRARGEVGIGFGLSGKSDTKLAQSLARMKLPPSRFAGLLSKDAVVTLSQVYPGSGSLLTLTDDVLDKLADQIQEALEEKNIKVKDKTIDALVDAFANTIKVEVSDAVMEVRGPSGEGQYSTVYAIHVNEGKTLEDAVKAFVAELPKKYQGLVKFDTAKIGGANVHEIRPPADAEMPVQLTKLLGNGPLYVALSDDVLVAACGDGALDLVKTALTGKPGPAPHMEMSFSLQKLKPLLQMGNNKRADWKTLSDALGVEKPVRLMYGEYDASRGIKARYGINLVALLEVVYFLRDLDKKLEAAE